MPYNLSKCRGREAWSAANNKESQRNSLTSCQVAEAERHGQLQKTKNPKEIHLRPVKLPRQRDMVSCKKQRIPKKFTYKLSSCRGRETWSAANNKESQRNSLTNCQVAKAERHGQLQTTKNPKEIHLRPVKLPRQRDMVSCKQQRIPKKFTYKLS